MEACGRALGKSVEALGTARKRLANLGNPLKRVETCGCSLKRVGAQQKQGDGALTSVRVWKRVEICGYALMRAERRGNSWKTVETQGNVVILAGKIASAGKHEEA